MAGSAPHPGPDLISDLKEVKEHDFVVKSLKESLKGVFIEEKQFLGEKIFGDLKHLCFVMEGRFQEAFDFERLCRILHPSPALGGYPKDKGTGWLQQVAQSEKKKGFCLSFWFL